MDKKQFVIKILFAIPTSILAYGVYRLLNYLVFELITYIYWVDIWWKTEHFLYNILIGIFAAYFFAEVLSWFHQKTNDKLVGYLESCFLVWLFIMWGMVSNSQYYLIIIESKVLEICLLIICLAVMVIVSLLRKKNRYSVYFLFCGFSSYIKRKIFMEDYKSVCACYERRNDYFRHLYLSAITISYRYFRKTCKNSIVAEWCIYNIWNCYVTRRAYCMDFTYRERIREKNN